MSGIWVAVKATTSTSGRSRKSTLKLWKSRPAAPAITTRLLGIGTRIGEPAAGSTPRRLEESLADPARDRVHAQVCAGHVAKQRVGCRLLSLRPQLEQLAARLARREPLVAVAP